ncbi:hypothetical protein PCANC_00901 [Puccinia coronata f. sp. avenae]|uniref:Cdc23 domain-containing protein n=1 Tax=Puccinia coronata f. sp. avenae TaxID=200324 RepID=A0A2N5T692_9BASI|nr:hypothetical protein PCANC_19498 [Puccinia coronata f. sp. avenae]PLW21017.1 hypothetical protein PCASD_15097 [Puccinia coronata f. sp. avenae]PLW48105.1 hypothetical protein PCASD_03619 [Puccinia coronata f. sp. avenae]PLW58197.1 hypothetical protein PCANC_00901 [Puccinia coronata f. sp. avenae]
MTSSSSSSGCIFELLPNRRSQDRFSLNPTTGGARKFHIRRLFDLLQLCLLRKQHDQARQTWSILIRCREVDFAMLWDLGLRVMHLPLPTSLSDPSEVDNHLSYLKTCRNLSDQETAKVLMEYISVLVSVGRLKEAFDELQLCLSTPPCSQHAGLHEYAGLVTLSIIPPPEPSDDPDDESEPKLLTINEYLDAISEHLMFGKAKAYFERAQSLDSTCVISSAYLELMSSYSHGQDDDD